MRKKLAILQVADTGPLESLAEMLDAVGYRCVLPGPRLRAELRDAGCDTVLEIKGLVDGMGYEQPMNCGQPFEEVTPETMGRCDLYVDVKGHRNCPKVLARWPNLAGKVLWYRINGGKPEHVVNARGDHGDEVRPPCPVLTPNRWYAEQYEACGTCDGKGYFPGTKADEYEIQTGDGEKLCHAHGCDGEGQIKVGWYETPRYCIWPPFVRAHEYEYDRSFAPPTHPLCLIHNAAGWGYGKLIEACRDKLGLRVHGAGSPDGLLQHREVSSLLTSAKCMVHLKSNDAPGYALYEALAAACPIVCPRRLIWRCKMQDLLVPGETCLTFDRETHDSMTDAEVLTCLREIEGHFKKLADPVENRRIGYNGRRKLEELTWSRDRPADVSSFGEFLSRSFSAGA